MILRILVNTANIRINNQVARVVRVYNRNVPDGITADEFTQKGGLLAGSAAGAFGELAPGTTGQYLTPDTAEPYGLKWATPTLSIDDTTNHLINGGFNFAQRQAPGTLTTITDGLYGPDRWKMTRANADLQYIRVDGSSETGLTSPYYGQFKKITNTGKLLLCQPLEYLDTLKFRGKTVNFQLQMKASASKTIKIAIVQLQTAGTADTIPTLVSAWGADGTDPTLGTNLATIGTPTSCSVTTSWQTFQFTATFPSTAKNLLVMAWSNAGFAANDTLSLAEAGLYFGSSIRSWTPRPNYQEYALCRARYRKSYPVDTAPGAAATNGYTHFIASSTGTIRGYVPLDMKATPTIKIYSINGTLNKVSNIGLSDVGTTVTPNAPTENALPACVDSGSGFTSGQFYSFHYTAEIEL